MDIHQENRLIQLSAKRGFVVPLEIRPAPRPIRGRGGRMTYPAWYPKLKSNIVSELERYLTVPKEIVKNYPWFGIRSMYYFQYPKTELSRVNNPLPDGALSQIKKDTDNLNKTLWDSLKQGAFIGDDQLLAYDSSMKLRTHMPSYFVFTLLGLPESLSYGEGNEDLDALTRIIREKWEKRH